MSACDTWLSPSAICRAACSPTAGSRCRTGTARVAASGRCSAAIEETLIEAEADPCQLVGAAISIAAPISPESGRMMVPGVLGGWNGPELAAQVARRWEIPVAVENDANLGALGEWAWGDAKGAKALLYIKIASRVGLGIVIDGRDLSRRRRLRG